MRDDGRQRAFIRAVAHALEPSTQTRLRTRAFAARHYCVGTVWPVEFQVTEASWEDVYRACYPQVYRGLVALGARPDEAEDAVRDPSVRQLEGADVSSAAGWLFVAALRRWRRRRWRERIFRPLIARAEPADPTAETRFGLFDPMSKLTRGEREVLVARYVVGLSPDETARALRIARGAVATTETQAARALRGDAETDDDSLARTVRAFADAAALIPLPRQGRLKPDERVRAGRRVAEMAALAGLAALLLGVVVLSETSARTRGADEPTAPPTPTPISDLTQLSEAAKWGRVWLLANGIVVLRPGWLPRSAPDYQVLWSVSKTNGGFANYDVAYYENASAPGATVWSVDFFADLSEAPSRGLFPSTGVAETVKVRGHSGELTGTGSPWWQLVWSERPYRYVIQGFAITREDLLRIAGSLAPVIDDTGLTAP